MDPLRVCIPNREALKQLEVILENAFESRVSAQSLQAVETYCSDGDVLALLARLDSAGDVAELVQELSGRGRIVEKHAHQALLGIIVAAGQKVATGFACAASWAWPESVQAKRKSGWIWRLCCKDRPRVTR